MEPAAGGSGDVLGHVGGEGNDIVIEGAFQFLAAFDLEGGAFFHHREIFLGNDALGGEGLAASNSICSQISSLRCSVQMSRISARE